MGPPRRHAPGDVYHTKGVKEMNTFSVPKSFTPRPATLLRGHFNNPGSVLADASLTVDEKRSLLASWASDARAVPDHPGLRRLDDGAIVDLDDILESLKQLERIPSTTRSTSSSNRFYRRQSWAVLNRILRRGENDDDDDDPTSPAPIAPRPRPPVFYDTRLPAAA